MKRLQELLEVGEDDKEKIRQVYGKTKESVEIDVKILVTWLSKQPHLPKLSNETVLENLLVRNKFRMEKTKDKIDKYFTLRGSHPEFFQNFDMDSQAFINFKKCTLFLPLPKLTDKQERIIVYKIFNSDVQFFNFSTQTSFILMLGDVQLYNDYSIGERIIMDWTGLTFAHFVKTDPFVIYKLHKLDQESYSTRIVGVEFINCLGAVDALLTLFKPILSTKMYNRITVHKDLESLQKSVSKKYLPKDYGGEQEDLLDLHENWIGEMKKQREFLERNARLVSDESLRPDKLPQGDMFGTEGTFKTLNID